MSNKVTGNEVYKSIPFIDGYYVSNKGNIKYWGGARKPSANSHGYMHLIVDGKSYKVHRLVAKIFIPNKNNLPYVNHKNGIKTDNRVENLEWCTAKYNVKHANDNGLINRNRGLWLHNSIPVGIVDDTGNFVKIFETMKLAVAHVSRSIAALTHHLNGDTKSCAGCKWKILTKDEYIKLTTAYINQLNKEI